MEWHLKLHDAIEPELAIERVQHGRLDGVARALVVGDDGIGDLNVFWHGEDGARCHDDRRHDPHHLAKTESTELSNAHFGSAKMNVF